MCEICDGATEEEARQRLADLVDEYGWAIAGVEAGGEGFPGWAYTLGLVDRFNHPELIVVGMGWGAGGQLLNTLGERVRAGHRLTEGSVVEVDEHLFPLEAVDPAQFDLETFAIWWDFYEFQVREWVPRVALQVFAPACLLAEPGDPWRYRLDTPDPVLGYASLWPD